jgi:hypothetical protein
MLVNSNRRAITANITRHTSVDAEPGRAGRSGEADDGHGVAGEGLPRRIAGEHHEVPDRPGDHGHDGSGAERVEHEVKAQQLPRIVDEVPGEAAVHRRCSGGASGWPTTTSRPALLVRFGRQLTP